MIGLRLAGLVAMGAGLAGCDSKPNNDAASVMQTVPVVVNRSKVMPSFRQQSRNSC